MIKLNLKVINIFGVFVFQIATFMSRKGNFYILLGN